MKKSEFLILNNNNTEDKNAYIYAWRCSKCNRLVMQCILPFCYYVQESKFLPLNPLNQLFTSASRVTGNNFVFLLSYLFIYFSHARKNCTTSKRSTWCTTPFLNIQLHIRRSTAPVVSSPTYRNIAVFYILKLQER